MGVSWRRAICALTMASAFTIMAQAASAETIRLGTAQQGSQNFRANTILANTLKKAGMDVSLQSFSGSGTYLTLMNESGLDLAATPSTDVYDAINGREAFAGNPLSNLRILAVLQKVPYGFAAKASDNINSIADLKGKRIAYGYASKPSAQNDVKAMLANGGLTIDDVEPVMVPGVGQGLDALISGRVDAAYWSLRSGKAIEADATLGGLRFLALSDDEQAVNAMHEFAPTAGTMVIEPSKSQVGISTAQPVLAFNYLLVVDAGLSDEGAYQITKAFYEDANRLGAEEKVMTGLDRSTIAQSLADLPFHDGAVRFYKEVGLQ